MITLEEEKYLKTLSKTKKVRIFKYDKKSKDIADEIIGKINKSIPELEVKFIGSPALRISGQRDIDLYVLCPQKEFPKYLQKMMRLFDIPEIMSKESIKWSFNKSGFDVELYLTDPTTPQMQRQLKVFEILKNNSELLKEYEKLKESFNGKLYCAYQKAKYKFYNRVLSNHITATPGVEGW